MSTAKFSIPVAMKCDKWVQYMNGIEVLKAIGYKAEHSFEWSNDTPWLVTLDGQYLPNQDADCETQIDYNLPLLRALASQREGDEFYEGEWVRTDASLILKAGCITRVLSESSQCWVNQGEGTASQVIHMARLRKLDARSIIAHFTPQPESIQPDQMVKGEWYHSAYGEEYQYTSIFKFDRREGVKVYWDYCLFVHMNDSEKKGRFDWFSFDKRILRPATPSEIAQAKVAFGITDEPGELKELPEKWCIERTEENQELVNNWLRKTHNADAVTYSAARGYAYHPMPHGWDGAISHTKREVEGYTEITTEQFKLWVLNELATTPDKPTLPESMRNFAEQELTTLRKLNTEDQNIIARNEKDIDTAQKLIENAKRLNETFAASIAERNRQITELTTFLNQHNPQA